MSNEEWKRWSMAKGTKGDYEGMLGFGNLLNPSGLNGLLDAFRKKNPHKKVNVGELMGYGFVFEGLDNDRGLAVALSRHPESPHQDFLEGNIFHYETFEYIKDWLRGDKFALMLCRGLGAMSVESNIQLENFNFIDVWVNTACPRVSFDDQEKFVKGVINLNDALSVEEILSKESVFNQC